MKFGDTTHSVKKEKVSVAELDRTIHALLLAEDMYPKVKVTDAYINKAGLSDNPRLAYLLRSGSLCNIVTNHLLGRFSPNCEAVKMDVIPMLRKIDTSPSVQQYSKPPKRSSTLFTIGHPPFNKNANSGSFKKGNHYSIRTEFKKGQVSWRKGFNGFIKDSAIARQNKSIAHLGHVVSDETKKKMRLSALGKIISQATKDKNATAHTNKHPSLATKIKMSKSRIAFFAKKKENEIAKTAENKPLYKVANA